MQPSDDNGLAEFVARYATPYDAESDDYDRPAFAADIKEGKSGPIYNAHSYHTKVPPRAIIPYILHYTSPGDLILDPFCGSGMTGVAALMCSDPPEDLLEQFPELRGRVGERRAILNDLSPAACHIARNYCTPVDVDALRREFDRIKAAVKEEFDWLYGTDHYEPALGVYATTQPDVLCRLQQLPAGAVLEAAARELWQGEKSWKLVDRVEVERRLGYSVSRLPLDHRIDLPPGFDLKRVDHWIVIPATIQYTVWSDVYRCDGMVTMEERTDKVSKRGKNAGMPIIRRKRVSRGCRNEIVLWDVAVDSTTAEINETFQCPHCRLDWRKRDLLLVGTIPVRVTYPPVGLNQKSTSPMWSRPVTAMELNRIKEIACITPDHLPISLLDEVDQGREMMRHGNLKRPLSKYADFYTQRNLNALARLWKFAEECESSRITSAIQFTLTSIINTSSKMRFYRPTGVGDVRKGTLYISSITSEMNVLAAFADKFQYVVSAHDALTHYTHQKGVVVRQGSAVSLSEIPTQTIDYIFADPPFGGNIYYADCSMLWEAWLGRFTDERQEIVVNERRKGGPFKNLPDYAKLMADVAAEMYRVLKPGRWATIEFNNSDGEVFEAIKSAVRSAGFEIVNMLFLDKVMKTFKQIKGASGEEDVVGTDVIFNLQKPAALAQRNNQPGVERDLVRGVLNAVTEHLRTLPERMRLDAKTYTDDHRTTPFLNTMLMNALIPRGMDVSQLNLPFIEQVCARYFRKVEGRWYLRSEAVGAGNGGALFQDVDVKDEPSAIACLRQLLRQRSLVLGEIRPLWMRAIGLLPKEVSQRLDLEKLLLDNFFRDPESNRWREPTEEERGRMNDDRVLRVLHDAERFLSRTLRREPGDAELCDWIDLLFRACTAVEERDREAAPGLRGFTATEGYRLICGIFPSVLSDRTTSAVFSRAAKQAAVASRRFHKSQPPDRAAGKERAKDDQPGLFDDL